jgi:5-methylcytosine-specific restriction enzyme A
MRPFHVHPELELDDANLITLCEKPGHDCHFVFGHFHDWKRWNPDVVADVAHYLDESQKAPGP